MIPFKYLLVIHGISYNYVGIFNQYNKCIMPIVILITAKQTRCTRHRH